MGGLIVYIGTAIIATSARVDRCNTGRFISSFMQWTARDRPTSPKLRLCSGRGMCTALYNCGSTPSASWWDVDALHARRLVRWLHSRVRDRPQDFEDQGRLVVVSPPIFQAVPSLIVMVREFPPAGVRPGLALRSRLPIYSSFKVLAGASSTVAMRRPWLSLPSITETVRVTTRWSSLSGRNSRRTSRWVDDADNRWVGLCKAVLLRGGER